MNRDELVGLAEDMTQVMLNQQRLDLARTFWHAEMSWLGPLGRRFGTEDFVTSVMEPFFRAFPDYHATNDVWVVDEQTQMVASWGHFTATHSDSFCGIPATGTQIDVRFMDIWSCRDGKLVENWVQVDHASFLHQIGAFHFTDVLPGIPARAENSWSPVAAFNDGDVATRQSWSVRAPQVIARALGGVFAGSPVGALPDATTWHGPLGFGTRTGQEIGALELAQAVRTAFPDLSASADLWLLDPATRRAAVWGHLHGTHAGAYLGIEPTHTTTDLAYMTFCQLDPAGAVQQLFTQIDNTTFLRDSGAVAQLHTDPLQRAPV